MFTKIKRIVLNRDGTWNHAVTWDESYNKTTCSDTSADTEFYATVFPDDLHVLSSKIYMSGSNGHTKD